MPFDRRDHFVALEAAMGDVISGDHPARFLQGSEREEFCSDAIEVRNENFPKSKSPLPNPESINTYILEHPCKLCPLWSVSYAAANGMYFWRSGVYGRGTGKNGIYIVGEALGAFETVLGEPFSGAAGTILSTALKKAGIVEDDCFTTNITRCMFPGSRVFTEDGPKRIDWIVKHRWNGRVLSLRNDGSLGYERITGWYKSDRDGRKGVKVSFVDGKGNSKGSVGCKFTEDHEFYTQRGWIEARYLTSEDLVATGTPAPGFYTEQVILGSLLGDGTFGKSQGDFSFSHTERNKDYAKLKAQLLSSFSPSINIFPVNINQNRPNETVYVRFKATHYFRDIRREFYKNGRKNPLFDFSRLNWFGLAIWYMDDGYLHKRGKNSYLVEFCLGHYSDEVVHGLLNYFQSLGFNPFIHVRSDGKVRDLIIHRKSDIELFFKWTSKYIVPSMRYKIPSFCQFSKFDVSVYNPEPSKTYWKKVVVTPILNNSPLSRNTKSVYCLDINNTHNFVTSSGVVHNCRPEGNRNPTAAEVKACQGFHFEHDLPYGFYDSYGMGEEREEFDPHWRPKLIIVLGAQALKHMMKMQKITQNRGIFFDHTFIDTPVKFIATWHPAMILRNPDLIRDFNDDLAKASRFVSGKEIVKIPEITSSLISTKKGYLDWMEFFLDLSEDIRLTVDIETTGLNYKTDKIASIAITCNHNNKPYGISFLTCPKLEHPESIHMVNEETGEVEETIPNWDDYPADWCGRFAHLGWWHLDLNQRDTIEFKVLKAVLENYPLTFQNGDFDIKFFWELGINTSCECDTMDAHLMLNEKPPHNLAYLTKAFIGESAGYKEKFREDLGDKTAYHEAPAKQLLQYNLDDTYYTQILRDIFLPRIHKEGFDNLFYQHAMPLQRTLTRISYRGLRVNRELLMDLASENRQQIQEKLKILYSEVGEFNVTSHPAVRNLLYNKLKLDVIKYTKKGELPSTDKDVLGMLSNVHHVPKLILEIRRLSKQNGTYLDGNDGLPKSMYGGGEEKGLLRFLDKNDRVHSHFFPWGTVSGRLSASQPNVLNVPKDSIFRNLFIPSDGYVYIDADYSQAELIVLAYLCKDPSLIEAVNSSDLHSKVVVDLLGISSDDPDFDKSRKIAKTINFGKVYGAGPKRLVEQLKFNPGGSIIISQEEAEEYHRRWNQMYPGVLEWGNNIHSEWRKNGELVSIFGRKMRFPDLSQLYAIKGQKDNAQMIESEKDRLSTNFPPQSAVGDATNRSLFMIDEAFEKRYGKWTPENCLVGPSPVLSLHDEILLEVPENMAEETAKILHEIMLLPLPQLNIQLKVDMEVKSSWGDKGTKITF